MIRKPTGSNILLAGRTIKNGGIVVIPTETFYALCCSATDRRAIKKLIRIKGRGVSKGIPVIFKSKLQLLKFVKNPSSLTLKLIDEFWPGPLSLIFQNKRLPKILEGNKKSILARVSPGKIFSSVMSNINFPLTATSANISGFKNYLSPKAIEKALGDKIDFIIDGGRLYSKKPSTIVNAQGSNFKILRSGKITYKALKRAALNTKG